MEQQHGKTQLHHQQDSVEPAADPRSVKRQVHWRHHPQALRNLAQPAGVAPELPFDLEKKIRVRHGRQPHADGIDEENLVPPRIALEQMILGVRMVVPPVFAREADDALTLERILVFDFHYQSHCTLVCTLAGRLAVVWIRIQLAGNSVPYSREICAGRMISASGLSASHCRDSRRGPAMAQLTVSPVIISEETRHSGPRIYRSSSKCFSAPLSSSRTNNEPLGQLHRPVVLDANPGITLVRCSHRHLAVFRYRNARHNRFVAAPKKQSGIAGNDILIRSINHQGIVRAGGAIKVPELCRTGVASAAAVAEDLLRAKTKNDRQFVAMGMTAFSAKPIRHRAKDNRSVAGAEHGNSRVRQERDRLLLGFAGGTVRRKPKPNRVLPIAPHGNLEQIRSQSTESPQRAGSAFREPATSSAQYRR